MEAYSRLTSVNCPYCSYGMTPTNFGYTVVYSMIFFMPSYPESNVPSIFDNKVELAMLASVQARP